MKTRIFVVIIVLLCFVAFYNGLVVREYTVKTDKLSEGQTARIVLVTDLHSHIYGKDQTKIVSLIRKQNPDIIALVGDIADDVEPIDGAKLLLDGIRNIAPVYYVTGNHEIWSRRTNEIKQVFQNHGAIVLENNYESVVINSGNFIIGGIDDPDIVPYEHPDMDWPGEVKNRFSELNNQTGYTILLSHRPELIDLYRELPFNLVLSGHSHGGQVIIPFLLNGLLAPNQGWFPKYAGGLYQHPELIHIVSRGVSFNPRLPRIFNPPEIVVINIINSK